MKKRIIASLVAAAALSIGVFSGCVISNVSVTSIEKTGSVGLIDYYTVSYSDGTSSTFTVTNGRDGVDGADGSDAQEVTVQDVYDTYKKVYNNDDMTYQEFCEKFLNAENDGTAALNSVLRSCMKVYTAFRELSYSPALSMYCGSAVVYKMEEDYTYILTNYHVVYDSKAYGSNKISTEISAYLYGSESSPVPNDMKTAFTYDDYAIKCEYVGGAITYDVAVLRASTEDILKVNPQTVPVSVNYNYSVGDNTYAVGNPDDGGISVTEGIVSVDSDYVTLAIDNTQRNYRSIRTDTALTHGNSGGGLFNMKGELIGLNNSGDSTITSMNYAIPASILTGVADGVIYYNTLNGKNITYKTLLGVTSVSENSRYIFDSDTGTGHIEEEVVIQKVESGSLAELLGLRVDDIITSVTVNDKKSEISRQFQIADLLLNVRAKDNIKIGYSRDGQKIETQAATVRGSDIVAID